MPTERVFLNRNHVWIWEAWSRIPTERKLFPSGAGLAHYEGFFHEGPPKWRLNGGREKPKNNMQGMKLKVKQNQQVNERKTI
jgi:hypothetical protein